MYMQSASSACEAKLREKKMDVYEQTKVQRLTDRLMNISSV